MDSADSDSESVTSTSTVVASRHYAPGKPFPSYRLRPRRCLSTTPCLDRDARAFLHSTQCSSVLPEQVKAALGISPDKINFELQNCSIYQLPRQKSSVPVVMETFQYPFDVGMAAHNMQLARCSIPVNPIISTRRPFGSSFASIDIRDTPKFISLQKAVSRYGKGVYGLIWPQLKTIATRLAISQSLWHSALWPEFILLDKRWNIRHVHGWKYCTKIRDPRKCSIAQLYQFYHRKLVADRMYDHWDFPAELRHHSSVVALDLAVEPYTITTVPLFPLRVEQHDRLETDESDSVRLPDFSSEETQRLVILCGRKSE